MCVEEVLRGEGSVNDVVAKYDISSREVLRKWIMRYNANKELKDYSLKREIYMAEARRKTSIKERRKIVTYYLNHEVSYGKVYSCGKNMREVSKNG